MHNVSRKQRTLEAIRRHFRDYGASPSHRELALAVGIRATAVGTVLRHLAADRHISLAIGQSRGIALVDRTAEFSDTELLMECHARGLIARRQIASATPLAIAYQIESRTDLGIGVPDLIAQLDDAAGGLLPSDAPADRAGEQAEPSIVVPLVHPSNGAPTDAGRRPIACRCGAGGLDAYGGDQQAPPA